VSIAYRCDYCREFTEKDYAVGANREVIPAVKGVHSGGDISWQMRVDGVPANSCLSCAQKNLAAACDSLKDLP